MSHAELLSQLNLPPFKPLPFFKSGMSQTAWGYYLPSFFDLVPQFTHHLALDDGDTLVIKENRPKRWQAGDRVVVLIHGLTGNYLSKYQVRLTRKLVRQGFCVIRPNLRGCGPGRGLAKNIYHSGRSEDARAILTWLKSYLPQSPITLVGFSLGGNIVLKMAGEDGERIKTYSHCDSIITVSPPIDLAASARTLQKPENKLLDYYFVEGLKAEVTHLQYHYPDEHTLDLSQDMTLRDFDNKFTAPRAGYSSAEEYYARCSAKQFMPNIQIPTVLLYSYDDPVVDIAHCFDDLDNPNIKINTTEHGGHVAWLGFHQGYKIRWMDSVLVNWIKTINKVKNGL